MSPAVAVVIVNFNAGRALADALDSLDAGLAGLRWEAVVVDNASTDGSEATAESRSGVRLLRQTSNLGFAAGVNAGVERTTAPLVLLMNPDCVLESAAGARLVEALGAHRDCGIVGPRILDPDGTLQHSARGDPTLLTGLFGRTGLLARWFPRSRAARRNLAAGVHTAGADEVPVVDWVSGACMLIRREVFDAVDGFDVGYFLYWEDADLCRRVRGRGWDVRYAVGAVVVHHVGQSSGTAPTLAARAFHDSAYRYYVTHVAVRPWHPARGVARVLLGARYRWKLMTGARGATKNRTR